MWGKKRISAMLMAVIVGVSAGMSQTVTYAEPTTDNTAAATDAATQQALTPEQQAQQEEQNVYNMEVQSNGWENWPQGPGTYGEAAIVMDAEREVSCMQRISTNMNIRQVSQKC